jgi:hypothetical protein
LHQHIAPVHDGGAQGSLLHRGQVGDTDCFDAILSCLCEQGSREKRGRGEGGRGARKRGREGVRSWGKLAAGGGGGARNENKKKESEEARQAHRGGKKGHTHL